MNPPIQIKLFNDLGKVPKGIRIELPSDIAHSLIHRHLAVPVGDFTLEPELIMDAEDCFAFEVRR